MSTPITLTGAYTCTHHNDKQRAECPVCLVAALTAERDQFRAEVERLRSDRDCEKRLRKDADEFRENAIERAERAEASLHAATEECTDVRLKWHTVMGTCAAKGDAIIELDEELARLRARAERAEDNLAALEQCHDDNCRGVVQIADELATAKERLRSEAMDDYAAIKDLQRDLAIERARLDWVFRNCKVIADGYAIHDREDLGVAMKEDAK